MGVDIRVIKWNAELVSKIEALESFIGLYEHNAQYKHAFSSCGIDLTNVEQMYKESLKIQRSLEVSPPVAFPDGAWFDGERWNRLTVTIPYLTVHKIVPQKPIAPEECEKLSRLYRTLHTALNDVPNYRSVQNELETLIVFLHFCACNRYGLIPS